MIKCHPHVKLNAWLLVHILQKIGSRLPAGSIKFLRSLYAVEVPTKLCQRPGNSALSIFSKLTNSNIELKTFSVKENMIVGQVPQCLSQENDRSLKVPIGYVFNLLIQSHVV